jgi:hypothetical protein
VIEMTVLTGVEFYAPVVVEAGGNLPICSEGLYDGKVAISDAQPLLGAVNCIHAGGELEQASCTEQGCKDDGLE